MKIEQVAQFKSCLTCAYRKFYPPSRKAGNMEFKNFSCQAAMITGKSIVKPQFVCEHWKSVTIPAD